MSPQAKQSIAAAEIGVRLLDDAHMAWVTAEAESGRAWRAWVEASPRERSIGYLAYRAALDREEAAANDLQRLTELARPCRDALLERAAGRLN